MGAAAVSDGSAHDRHREVRPVGKRTIPAAEQVGRPVAATQDGVFRDRVAVANPEDVEHPGDRLRQRVVVVALRPRHIPDDRHLDILISLRVEVVADFLDHVQPVHGRDVANVVLRSDPVRQDRAGAAGIHVAGPDAVHVEGDSVAGVQQVL